MSIRVVSMGVAALLAMASCAQAPTNGAPAGEASAFEKTGEVVKAGGYSLRAPPADVSCDGAVCPSWQRSVKTGKGDVQVSFLRKFGLFTYRWTMLQASAVRGRPVGRASEMSGEQLADLMLANLEQDVLAGIDIWRSEDVVGRVRSFDVVKIEKRTVTVGEKTLRRLYWKSRQRAATLIPSFTIVEGALYVEIPETVAPAPESMRLVSFLLWDQYQSGRAAKDVLAQIEPVIVSFQRD